MAGRVWETLKRATLVGESTGGGAHMVRTERLDDHFTLVVRFARSISPITKTNWEGTGVEPDVRVSAAEALTERHLGERVIETGGVWVFEQVPEDFPELHKRA